MTEADAPIVWQRVPQGWIELVAFDDDTVAAAWWEAYLSPAREWLDAGTPAAMTRAFDTARETLRTIPYAVAGIFPYLDGEPTVFFLGTTILPAPDDRDAARTVASLVGLVRFGDDMRTESFVALDGRVGSASLGRATLEDGTIVGAITGEIPLPDAERGTVFVLPLSLDPDRLEELGPYAALALDSTRLLAPGDAPAPTPAPPGQTPRRPASRSPRGSRPSWWRSSPRSPSSRRSGCSSRCTVRVVASPARRASGPVSPTVRAAARRRGATGSPCASSPSPATSSCAC